MARVAAEPNGFWKTLAVGAVGLVILMLGWFLVYQTMKLDKIADSVNDIKLDIVRFHGTAKVGEAHENTLTIEAEESP